MNRGLSALQFGSRRTEPPMKDHAASSSFTQASRNVGAYSGTTSFGVFFIPLKLLVTTIRYLYGRRPISANTWLNFTAFSQVRFVAYWLIGYKILLSS